MTSVSTDRRYGINSGIAIKVPCMAATTANITLSGLQTIDNYSVQSGDRILVKNQTTTSDNGIYRADTGAWTRDADFDGSYDIVQGTFVAVANGTVNGGTAWKITTVNPVVGSALSFAVANELNISANLAAGTGASLVGYARPESGAITKTVSSKLSTINIDISDFGDNTTPGTTDMTSALTAAIAALPSTGGTITYKGANLISSAFTLSKKIRFRADGAAGTTTSDLPTSYFKKASTLNADLFTTSANGIIFEGGGLIGVAGNGGNGITIATGRCSLDDVMVALMGQDGVRLGTDAGVNANIWYMNRVRAINNVRRGIYIHDGSRNANSGTSIGCEVRSNGENGLHENEAYGNTHIGMVAQANTGIGAYFGALANEVTVIGGDFEGNTGQDITIDTGATQVSILFPHTNVSPWRLTNNGTNSALYLFPQTQAWTPVIGGAGGTSGQVYSSQIGWYTRKGNQITAGFRVAMSTKGTITGAVQIQGLPFASINDATIQGNVSPLLFSALATNWISICANITINTTAIDLYGIAAAAGTNFTSLATTDLNNTSQFIGEVTYTIK